MNSKANILFSSVYGLNLFFVSLAVAWAVMFNFDFFYATWHDHGGIKEGIEEFAPQNRYKKGFEGTTRLQRVEIFHQINLAVHRGGEGLASITYQSPVSQGKQVLLREAEVIHLQDVARLIEAFIVPVILIFLMWPASAIYYHKKSKHLPSLPHQAIGFVGLLLAVGLCLLFFGSETVFNTLHIWIFPKDHEWFFYYQDSLMSTMMFAPLLFAWIAGAWVVLSVSIYFLINILLAKFCLLREARKRQSPPP